MAFHGELPWDSGPLAFIAVDAADPVVVPQLDVWAADAFVMPPLPEQVQKATVERMAPTNEPRAQQQHVAQPRGRRQTKDTPAAQDFQKSQRAVDQWQLILTAAGDSSSLHKLAHGDPEILRKAIEQTLEVKSPATSSKRAGAWLLYMKWAQGEGVAAFPVTEGGCNCYLEKAVTLSPTRATSFLEALGFVHGLFQLCNLDELLTPRNKGLAARGGKRKRTRLQRLPLAAASVEVCEAEVASGHDQSQLSEQEFIILGFLLFRIHTRLRCGDAARVTVEPFINGDFVEAELAPDQHKTGHARAFKDLALPVAGFARGVLDSPWCAEWLKARDHMGLDAEQDGTLMPEACEYGVFGTGRMSTSEIGRWERSILMKMGIPEAASPQYGTHSAKATLLSWAAKADLTPHHRRLLGSHIDKDEKSMLTYARDALAGPLGKLGTILQAVRERRFNPDASHSGRWVCAAFSSASLNTKLTSARLESGDEGRAEGAI